MEDDRNGGSNMTKWEYGGAYKKYPLDDEEPYIFDDGSIVQVHDIFNPLPEFMKKADLVFVDPPWNQGNMTSFYTKADKVNTFKYEPFYKRIFECIQEISPKMAFVEVGKEYLPDFIIEMRKIYKYVTFYNSSYYHRDINRCYIVQGSDKRLNLRLDDMDEEDIIAWITENVEYDCIADLCMGRGLVGLYSYKNNKRFVGTELNHKRLSVLIERIEDEKRNA